ncbi:hypothetical protein M2375_002220 [Comamonas sp. BIGb0152]|uniref:hypothetical protein n=1 Tax=Comamonas sp. BIGb0152 TaxID=2940601 RepID=UPI00216887E9|nr:hypothetical protein [Comamonas sp. BIGb0152]MCS4293988.1 hypothetical protein [Comamonas sp. BIGb0152]
MKWIFSFLIVIQSINSYANVSFDLRIEKCTKDEVVVKHVLHAENEKSLHVYELAMPWSFGDFGVNYNIFHKKNDVYTKIRQDYFASHSVDVLNLSGRKISKFVEISSFFGGMRDVLEWQDLYVYWTYHLISQDASYRKRFEGFFIIPKNCKF